MNRRNFLKLIPAAAVIPAVLSKAETLERIPLLAYMDENGKIYYEENLMPIGYIEKKYVEPTMTKAEYDNIVDKFFALSDSEILCPQHILKAIAFE